MVLYGRFGDFLRMLRRLSPHASETFSACFGDFLRMLRRLSPDAPETFSGCFGELLRMLRRKSPENPGNPRRVNLLIYNDMKNTAKRHTKQTFPLWSLRPQGGKKEATKNNRTRETAHS